ncbi:MAG: hypothetical protein HY550_00095 [Elusimicrobia bacterium]|nr:hypothetical protein [Elusimicrobiota bacterium]
MKKSNILIAAFAVIIAAVPFAAAEGFGVDFDRGAFRTADFMEAVKTSDMSRADNISITPAPVTAATTLNIKVYILAASSLQKLRKEVLTMPGLSKEFLQLINEENTVVLYNKDSVFLTTLVGDIQHIILESNDRKLMEYISKQKTGPLQANLRNKGKCWEVIKLAWKIVNGISVAYEIITTVCDGEGDSTPPANPNLPGASTIPGVYHERMGGL